MNRIPIIGEDQAELAARAHAEADAREIIAGSPIIQVLLNADIIIKRIFRLIQEGMENELNNGWEVTRPDLVVEIIMRSANARALTDPSTPSSIREEILTALLPVVDIFCQMELEANKNEQQVISGGDVGTSAELGAILLGTAGDAEQQAGQHAEGD